MVAQITTGYPTDENGRPYRRRRYIPAIIALVVLLVVGTVVWILALSDGTEQAAPTDCNQPAGATSAAAPASPAQAQRPTTPQPLPDLTIVGRDEMLAVAPAALSTFQVRVLNASTERGAARSVSDDLTRQGYTPVADTPYGDDPLYPDHNLDCVAQIRFGPAGKTGAAAVWIAFPCAQLVSDDRHDTTVDVALGEYYRGHRWSQDMQAAMDVLKAADPKHPETGVDPSLLNAVHSTAC